jgi:hypothetical protein
MRKVRHTPAKTSSRYARLSRYILSNIIKKILNFYGISVKNLYPLNKDLISDEIFFDVERTTANRYVSKLTHSCGAGIGSG